MKKQHVNSKKNEVLLEKFSTAELKNLSVITGGCYGGEVDSEPDAL